MHFGAGLLSSRISTGVFVTTTNTATATTERKAGFPLDKAEENGMNDANGEKDCENDMKRFLEVPLGHERWCVMKQADRKLVLAKGCKGFGA